MSTTHKFPYEWQIGLRYTRAGKRSGRNRFISFISMASVTGIALGVAALIVVLSVMNGFTKEVTNRMLSVVSHIEVYDAHGAMHGWRTASQEALRNPAVAAGILVALNVDLIVSGIEQLFKVRFLSQEVYLIDSMPSELRWGDVSWIGGVAVLLSFLATIYPSWSASRVKPAEALRYE